MDYQDTYIKLRTQYERFCYSKAIVFEAKVKGRPAVMVKKVRCKSWYCRHCAPRNLKRLKARLYHFIGNQSMRLMTLTTKDNGQSPEKSLQDISLAWDVLLKRMKRKYGKIKYFRIVQFHKNGQPHMHILVDKYISQSWLSTNWNDIFGAYIVDIRNQDNHHAINYVSRYIARELEADDYHHALFNVVGRRRFSFSRHAGIDPAVTEIAALSTLIEPRLAVDFYHYIVQEVLSLEEGSVTLHCSDDDDFSIIVLDNVH